MNAILTILAFLIGFTLMVVVHEWGHYITGRMFGAKIDEFAIGMGPKIYSRRGKKTNTVFSIRSIPIGGFVKFTGDEEIYGEQAEVTDVKDPHLLPNLKVWKRFIIYAAGAFMNVVLGFVLIIILLMGIGYATHTPTVGDIIANSPAHEAGLEPGDIILQIDGVDIIQDDYNAAKEQLGTLITEESAVFTVKRGEEIKDISVTPEYDEEAKAYKVGFYFGYTYQKAGFGEAVVLSVETAGSFMTLIVKTFGALIFKGEGAENVGGVVEIVKQISASVNVGFMRVLELFASLTLNLAVVNMLPFPALDGGKCVLLLIEGIIRRPINRNVEGWLNLAGFALLMLLMVVITAKDIFSLFN